MFAGLFLLSVKLEPKALEVSSPPLMASSLSELNPVNNSVDV